MERQGLMQRARQLLATPAKKAGAKARAAVLDRVARLLVRTHPTNASGNNMSQR